MPRLASTIRLVLAIVAVASPVACRPAVRTPGPADDSAFPPVPPDSGDDAPAESVPPGPEDGPDQVYSDETVHAFAIDLDAAALAALTAAPTEYVAGSFTAEGRTYAPVGVRLKGNSSFEGLDGKPAWKVRFNEYEAGWRFHGLERLTLDNNVWDATSMSETLGYRFFREVGSPAPRTGYATVSLNGAPLGLYTVVEAMDDVFMETWWPAEVGALYEMTRTCDFTSDCSCFDLQDATDGYDPSTFAAVCAAVNSGSLPTLRDAFEWDRLLAFFAAERAVNHPDSYTYNLNNYFIHHDPVTGRAALSPWGGDSMFTYRYPPDQVGWPCEPMPQYDNLHRSPYGWLGRFCEETPECWRDLSATLRAQADTMEALDLPAWVVETADRIRPYVYEETRLQHWGPENFEYAVGCFETWTRGRPAGIRAFLGE